MKKLVILSVLTLVTISACSQHEQINTTAAEQVAAIKPVAEKAKKHSHKKQITGVISVDVVNDNNRVHLLIGKQEQDSKTLWYQFSDDGGVSWSTENKILNSDNIPAKIGRGNDAQIVAQQDNIVVTWTKFDSNKRFNAGAMLAARSTDGGLNWQYSESPPDWKQGPHGYIDMAADNIAMHAVWLDRREGGKASVKASQGLRYAHSLDGGLSWQKNTTLDGLSCSCCWNTIKTDTKGNAFVLYRDKQPSDLSIGVINQQQQWQRLSHVGAFNWQFDGCPHIGGSMDFQAVSNQSRIHAVVGTGHPEHLGVFYLYSNDAGKNWSNLQQFGDESAIHADIASHDNGRVVLVWDMMGEDGLTVFAAESTDQGKNWTTPNKLSSAGFRATHPRVVKTKQGFLVLWTESDGQNQRLMRSVL